MKIRKLLVLCLTVLLAISGCSSTSKYNANKHYKEKLQKRSAESYEKAIAAIEERDFSTAYFYIDLAYLWSRDKPETLKNIKSLIAENPELIDAALESFTQNSLQEYIDRKKGKPVSVPLTMARKLDYLKLFHPDSGTIAEKRFIEYFKHTPKYFRDEYAKKKKQYAEKHKNDTKSTFINFSAKGNLEVTQPISCVDIKTLSSQYTPADIFTGISDCVQKNETYMAARLYTLAITYGYFDKLRMVDKSARSAINALSFKYLASINKEYIGRLKKEVKKQSKSNPKGKEFKVLCADIIKLGKPVYTPNYMINHGMAKFTGRPSGVLQDFDEDKAWDKAIHNFLGCS